MSDLKIILKETINNIPYQFDNWDARYWGYVHHLRDKIVELRTQGDSKADLTDALIELRDEFDLVETFKADMIVEQLTFLAGFCSPGLRID
jgi:hypothetical protein